MKRGVPDGASLFESALFFGMSHDAKYAGHKKSGVETSHGDWHSVRDTQNAKALMDKRKEDL